MDCAKPLYDHSESGHVTTPSLSSFNSQFFKKQEKYHHCYIFDKASQINGLHLVEKVIY